MSEQPDTLPKAARLRSSLRLALYAAGAFLALLVLWRVVGIPLMTHYPYQRVLSEAEIGDGPIPAINETAMSPGSTITATTATGTISIKAGDGLKRSYTWEGDTRSVEMVPREKRWYGSLGLWFPGPGHHWEPHNGITRGVVEEGQQHFKTVDDAMKWIDDDSNKSVPLVYRNDALAVGWSKNLERSQLNVTVWQIYVDGQKPSLLPGSQDDLINVTP